MPRRKSRVREWVPVVSSALTALTVILAAAKYLFGFFSPIELQIQLPPVIEFRCSSPEFQGWDCLQGPRPDLYHLTITAALNLRAMGEATKEATITGASATLRPGPGPARTYKLTGLWSADFVPGQPFRRQQVTVSSLRGGESRSQEMWFFPIADRCDSLPLQDCQKKERANFLPWQEFISSLHAVDPKLPLRTTAYEVEFVFDYKEGERSGRRSIACHVEISNTVRRLANPDNYRDRGIVSLSAPCVT